MDSAIGRGLPIDANHYGDIFAHSLKGPVAQRLEQGTHNPLVESSILSGPTSLELVSYDEFWRLESEVG